MPTIPLTSVSCVLMTICAAFAAGETNVVQTDDPSTRAVLEESDVRSGTDGGQLDPTELFKKVSPAIVEVRALDEYGNVIASGSGFIVRIHIEGEEDPIITSLHVVTCYHVIRYAVSLELLVAGHAMDAGITVAAEDPDDDLAVLFCFVNGRVDIEPLAIAAIPDLSVGARVFAIGSPQGLSNTLSEGLISGLRATEYGNPLIQITCPISPGSSGGPLLSAHGNVLGVVTSFLAKGQNLNFAVSISAADISVNGEPSRAVSEGRSIDDEYKRAVLDLEHTFASASPLGPLLEDMPGEFRSKYLDEEVGKANGTAYLLKSHQHFVSMEFDSARKFAEQAIPVVAREFKYLAYYMAARTHYHSYWATHYAQTDRVLTRDEKRQSEQLRRSLNYLEEANQLKADFAPVEELIAKIYTSQELDVRALVAADRLVRLVPYCPEALLLRGDSYNKLEEYALAEADYRQVVEMRPCETIATVNIAYIKLHEHKYEEALALGEEARKRQGDDRWARQLSQHTMPINVCIILATAHAALGNCEEAQDEFRQYLASIPVEWHGAELRSELGRQVANCK